MTWQELYKDYEAEGKVSTSKRGETLRRFSKSYGLTTYNLIQQSIKTRSKWAELARSGHNIVQVIRETTNQQLENGYVGVYVDGKFQSY